MYRNLCAKFLLLSAPLCVLLGCETNPTAVPQAKPETVSTASNAASPCAVRITQEGTLAPTDVVAGTTRYLLKGARFRIEVSNALCEPSIGVFTKPSDFFYVARSSHIATSAGFEMAGDNTTNDVLVLRSEDPRLIPPFEDIFSSSEDKYRAACAQLGKCPLKIRAFRTYWPFAGDAQGTPRGFAEFNRLASNRPLDGTKGDVPVVIYTKLVPGKSTREESNAFFKVFAIQPFILHFE